MSYARSNGVDSDVYVIDHVGGWFQCYCGAGGYSTTSRTEMIEHLNEHMEAGQRVPQRTFDRLREEIDREGDEWNG